MSGTRIIQCNTLVLLLALFATSPAAAQKLPVTTDSEEARALFERALDKLSLVRGTEAGMLLERAIQADSSLSLAYALLPMMHHYNRFNDAGLAEKAVHHARNGTPAEQTYAAAVLAFISNDTAEALDLGWKLHEKYPDSWIPTWFLATVHYDKTGDFAEAERIVRIGLERHPNHGLLRNWLGYTLRQQGKIREAKAVFQENIRLRPDQPNPYDSAAWLYAALGNLEKAANLFEKSIAVDPDFAYGGSSGIGVRRDALGYIYQDLGRYVKAEAIFKENVRRHPAEANPYDSLGELYLVTGRYDAAIEQFETALEIDPEFAISLNHLAQARIERAYAGLAEAMARGDAAEIAERYYTVDAVVFPPDAGPVKGRAAIEEAYSHMVEEGLVVEPDPVEVEVYGDAAYERGSATLRHGEVPAVEQQYVAIWKKRDGVWRTYCLFIRSSGHENTEIQSN